ncbi:MAG: hypothetical protein R3E90_02475 [Marinicella sp.]
MNKAQLSLYEDLIDLFVKDAEVFFKATVVLNKHLLDHDKFNAGSHSDFYYKMAYYTMRDYLKKDCN